jgi:hypothetical protein
MRNVHIDTPHVIIVLCNDRHLTLRLDKKTWAAPGSKGRPGHPLPSNVPIVTTLVCRQADRRYLSSRHPWQIEIQIINVGHPKRRLPASLCWPPPGRRPLCGRHRALGRPRNPIDWL